MEKRRRRPNTTEKAAVTSDSNTPDPLAIAANRYCNGWNEAVRQASLISCTPLYSLGEKGCH